MTIKNRGGIFGRNPSFNDVDVDGTLSINGAAIPAPADTLTSSDIGSTVQGYDADTTKNDVSNTFTAEQYFNLDVGVGTIDPAGKMHIKAAADSVNGGLRLESENGTTFVTLDHNNAGNTRFYQNGVACLRIDSSNNVEVDSGNLIIGTSGKGIDFSATSGTGTSELFDDYEEGTWTVTLYDAASAGNASATTATGYYTKTGRQVTIWFSLSNIDTTGMTAGNVIYVDLPFATGSGNISAGAVVTDNVSFGGTGTALYLRAGSGAARASFKNVTSASGDGNTVVSHFSTGVADIDACTMTYFV